MRKKLAIVFCVHHKPWLMMGSLLTLASQEHQDADLFFAYNLGGGESTRSSYAEYRDVAKRAGVNTQLSPFDERVRAVCQVRGRKTVELEYENDHGLDSGVWYKFIRDGWWRDYDYVLFAGEGLLMADPRVLRSLIAFADRRGLDFVGSGHEKRRSPRAVMQYTKKRGVPKTEMDEFHDRMIQATFDSFCRDPEFRALYDQWGSDFPTETEHHVPGVTIEGESWRRLRGRIRRRWDSPYVAPDVPLIGRLGRELPRLFDEWSSRAHLRMREPAVDPGAPLAFAAGSYAALPITHATEIDTEQSVTFHRYDNPEWFGCTVIHLMSNRLLDRFSGRLEHYGMYDVLDLPFAGSALEVVWGFVPKWLGVGKWFTNGFHRVRKHFATFQREDYPPEIAGYINRYHRGRLVVGADGDYLKLKAWRASLGDLSRTLPAEYFL